MNAFTVVTHGPWRIRTSVIGDDRVALIAHDGKSETVAVETHADLALLRDAITEYLNETEGAR